jgi:hypothetical protein
MNEADSACSACGTTRDFYEKLEFVLEQLKEIERRERDGEITMPQSVLTETARARQGHDGVRCPVAETLQMMTRISSARRWSRETNENGTRHCHV